MSTAAAVIAVHLLLFCLVMASRTWTMLHEPGHRLTVFDVPLPALAEMPALSGSSGRRATRKNAAPVTRPRPKLLIPVHPVIAATPAPAAGAQASSGASTRSEQGTGGGSSGEGSGSGGSGIGPGGGALAQPAELIAGKLNPRDYPRSASRAGIGGTVVVRYTVGTDGRATGCAITTSSGNPDLDSTTCRLIEQRFRYQPARDGTGAPVPQERGWKQVWWLD